MQRRVETQAAKAAEWKEKTKPAWKPIPNSPQERAYHSEADELYYGGSAGGGKSSLLVGLALTSHWRSIIFRREYPQLKEIEEQIDELLPGYGKFNHQNHTAILKTGRKVELASVPHVKDVQKYQGRPHDLLCFDEGPQFLLEQYLFLTGWNRSKRPGQRCRVVIAGNPPTTPEGRWIVTEFAPWLDETFPDTAEPGELRWYIREKEKESGQTVLRWFKTKISLTTQCPQLSS
jgi:hypothetical protein